MTNACLNMPVLPSPPIWRTDVDLIREMLSKGQLKYSTHEMHWRRSLKALDRIVARLSQTKGQP